MSRIAKAAVLTAAVGTTITGAAGLAVADSGAQGAAVGSPGVVSGNVIQVPLHVPINLCGNSIDILIGLLNPTFGNTCVNS
ncbi:chaplin [Streptomyces sp. NPDC053048]|uniref:chaplin n=1 Tax=Streptomyces sp. NPDC053048 TaxID=3365694 RepID=UPI0037D967DC